MNYRPDIDGLRTIAVVPVVLFHANVHGFTGGYVGVDIFFVISGFLITTIIHCELGEGRFSILRFYERRARRILPALFAVMVVGLIAGWFLLAPSDYDHMGQSMLSALLFVSNMWFWQNSGGYFDGATDYLPMLHTWSLAVEEQFYIFFPLLLMLLHRIGRRLLLPVIVLLVAGSLVVAIWATPRMPSASFYLLPTWIWELGIGSLLALGLLPSAAPKALREVVGALGLVGVLAPVFVYDGSTVFPGLAALPPVLGAAALIWAGTAGPVLASRLLSLRPMVWIGLISYSLYLWHWPIMAFARNRLFTVELEPMWQVMTVLASLVAGWISWRFIERPFRVPVRAGGMGQGRIFSLSGAGMAVLGGMAGALALTDGIATWRFDEKERAALASLEEAYTPIQGCFGRLAPDQLCVFGTDDPHIPVSWVLWGDSHAATFLPAFETLARKKGRKALFAGASSCPPLDGVLAKDNPDSLINKCDGFRTALIKAFGRMGSIETFFLMARWPVYVEGRVYPIEGYHTYDLFLDEQKYPNTTALNNMDVVRTALEAFQKTTADRGQQVFLIGTTPEIPWDVALKTKANLLFGEPFPDPPKISEVTVRQQRTTDLFEAIAEAPNVAFLPLAARICDPYCPTHDDQIAFYKDNNHLNAYGARRLVLPILESFFQNESVHGARFED